MGFLRANFRHVLELRPKFPQSRCRLVPFRHASFLAVESRRTSASNDHIRSVLLLRDDCYLFDPRTYPASHCCEKELGDLVTETSPNLLTAMLTNTSIMSTKLEAIDQFCLDNYQSWPANKRLYVMDIWQHVEHARRVAYIQQLQANFLDDIHNSGDVGQMLQMLYCLGHYRTPLHWRRIQDVQQKLLDTRESLTLDEQSIFCSTLVRSGSKLPNSTLADALISSLSSADLVRCNGIAISAILKAIRWYSTPTNVARTKALQQQLVEYAKVADIKSLTHIGLLGYNLSVFNYELVEVIVRKFSANLDAIRIKDVERAWLILAALAPSKFHTDDGAIVRFSQLVQEHLLQSLNSQYPDTVINCIAYLIVYGQRRGAEVKVKLIEWALGKGLAACKQHRKAASAEQLLIVDCYARVSLGQNYNGPNLPAEQAAQLRQNALGSIDGHNKSISDTIQGIFTKNGFHIMPYRIVPYSSTPELIFLYDTQSNKTARLPAIPENSRYILHAEELHGNAENVKAVAIVTSSWQQQIHAKQAYHGMFQYKLIQLRALGFYTIVIRHHTWRDCASLEEKQRLLIRLLGKHEVFALNRLY